MLNDPETFFEDNRNRVICFDITDRNLLLGNPAYDGSRNIHVGNPYHLIEGLNKRAKTGI